jgi:hypothetical protein
MIKGDRPKLGPTPGAEGGHAAWERPNAPLEQVPVAFSIRIRRRIGVPLTGHHRGRILRPMGRNHLGSRGRAGPFAGLNRRAELCGAAAGEPS